MSTYDFWLELIGYAASAFVAVSLMMTDVRRLRRWNLAGSATFSLYGALIGAWPVFAVNGFIAIVNTVHIVRLYREERASRSPAAPDRRIDRRPREARSVG